jgi:hypothetical protein
MELCEAYVVEFIGALRSLEAGVNLFFGDDDPHRTILPTLRYVLDEVGFLEIVLVWNQDGVFVIGGQEPISAAV